jgi:hypothetical protein
MEEVPYWFWMIVVAGLSGMLGLIMYHTAMLLRESTLTVREFKYVVMEMHDIMDAAKIFLERVNRIAETISSAAETISTTILRPVAMIGTALASVRSLIARFTGGDPEDVADEES